MYFPKIFALIKIRTPHLNLKGFKHRYQVMFFNVISWKTAEREMHLFPSVLSC